jgi:hypothetical protein
MPNSTVTFGAVGDINLGRGAVESMKTHGIDWPFEKVFLHLKRAELLFGNMESVLLPPDYPDDQLDPRALASKFDATAALKNAGFGFMCLANNHIIDAGGVGMIYTRDRIEAHGITTGGVGPNQDTARHFRLLHRQGLKFGFLCYAEDSNYSLSTTGPCHAYYTREAVLEDIKQYRNACDILVVSIHADLEFMETPSMPRRQAFREFARAGAAIVLGHHPHVPQGIERIDNSLIAYSLGNFVFGAHSGAYMRENLPGTSQTFILLVDVNQNGVKSFERVPCIIEPPPNERPVPLEGEAAAQMISYFEELDRKVLDNEFVQTTWRNIALRRMRGYLEKAKHLTPEDLLNDTLGRLLLVQENRMWVDEVLRAVKENWIKQAQKHDPLHRPHFAMERRKKSE